MKTQPDSLFPGHEYIWLADYSVRRRKRKLFLADERHRERMWGKSFKPQPYFETEREARALVVENAKAEVANAKDRLKRAEAQLRRAVEKLAGVAE